MTVNLRDFIQESLASVWEDLHNATDDLTHDQLIWRVSPKVNSIGFLLWHVGRVEDNFVQRFIQRGDEVWSSGGWQEKFGYATRGIGTGFTQEEGCGGADKDHAGRARAAARRRSAGESEGPKADLP